MFKTSGNHMYASCLLVGLSCNVLYDHYKSSRDNTGFSYFVEFLGSVSKAHRKIFPLPLNTLLEIILIVPMPGLKPA